jgi:hypothetical protein
MQVESGTHRVSRALSSVATLIAVGVLVRDASAPGSCTGYGILLLGSVALAALGTACHPNEPTNVSELDVVATAHDDTVNYGAIQTYVMPDSVVEIVPPESVLTALPFNHAYDQLILDGVAAKLTALGYTRLPTYDLSNPPSVVVTIRGIAVRNTDIYVSYPWWGYWGWYGWPCCYGPGWGVGYPVVTASQYDVGTIAVDMWDTRRADQSAERIPAIWVAVLRGLLEGSSVDAPARIQQAIDRAFAQSPYLGHP